jgi:hypothetical protein
MAQPYVVRYFVIEFTKFWYQLRLKKELKAILAEPIPNIVALPLNKNILEWYTKISQILTLLQGIMWLRVQKELYMKAEFIMEKLCFLSNTHTNLQVSLKKCNLITEKYYILGIVLEIHVNTVADDHRSSATVLTWISNTISH